MKTPLIKMAYAIVGSSRSGTFFQSEAVASLDIRTEKTGQPRIRDQRMNIKIN